MENKKLVQVLKFIRETDFTNDELSTIADTVRGKIKNANQSAKASFSIGQVVKVTHPNWEGGTATITRMTPKKIWVRDRIGSQYGVPPRFIEKL